MKKHIKPAFHLAVGAVLAIMFAQQKPVNPPPSTIKEKWINLVLENPYAVDKLLTNERDARLEAINHWQGALKAGSEGDTATFSNENANYLGALTRMNNYRKGRALLDAEPLPPTEEEKTLIGTGGYAGLQVIPPFKKEDAIKYEDTFDTIKAVRDTIAEEKERATELEREAERDSKIEAIKEEYSNESEAGASKAPAPAAEAPEAPAPEAEASEAPAPEAEAPEAPAPEEAPKPEAGAS